jgi:predicted HicB family RNase H-like nuclease
MKYKGYTGVVEFDEESQVLFGRVIGLRDVITFEGNSVAEVTEAFHDSVDYYLEFCAQRGKSPEKPYSGQFVLRLKTQLHRKLADLAEIQKTSLNSLIEDALESLVSTSALETHGGTVHRISNQRGNKALRRADKQPATIAKVRKNSTGITAISAASTFSRKKHD